MASIPWSERIGSREEALRRLGGKSRRALRGVETYLRERPNGDIDIVYRLTSVVTYHTDGSVTLRTGGWTTATTKFRINAYSPICVFQRKGVWYVNCRPWYGSPKTFRQEDGEWVPTM